MKKIIAAVASVTAIAALAVPALASANVTVNASGVGSIGKGDVQNALGYANDAAFQADAGHITFSYQSSGYKTFFNGVKCGLLTPTGGIDSDHIRVIDRVQVGTTLTTKTPSITILKNGAGKVTGYTANGFTTSTSDNTDYNVGHVCNADEHFAGWVDAANVISNEFITGSDVLQVSGNGTTVALPNTPVL